MLQPIYQTLLRMLSDFTTTTLFS